MPPTPRIILTNNGAQNLIPDPEAIENVAIGNKIAGVLIRPAKELALDAFNGLFYAYPGVGKTTVSGMFAEYEKAQPVLNIDGEGGASVLSHLDNVDVAEVRSWSEIMKLMDWLEKAPIGDIKYKTVCLDNITEFHLMHLKMVSGGGKVQIDHYGMNTEAILTLARRARDLSRFRGIHTVLLAWQDQKKDDSTGVTRQIPAMTDKLAARLPGVPNNVGHITVMNNPPLYTRHLSFAATPLNDAKFRRAKGDRSHAIPDDIFYGIDDNPIADMLETIYEGVAFPADKYKRPTRRSATANSDSAEAVGTSS